MYNSDKKINVDLEFIIEQITSDSFVCSNLPDRVILIEKKEDSYQYTTSFHKSGFSFSYSTQVRQYKSRPLLTIQEQIQKDLSSSFFNYVAEEFSINTFKDLPTNKKVVLEFNKVDQLHYFFITINSLKGNAYSIFKKAYVYDNEHDDLLEMVTKKPDKLLELLDCDNCSEAYLYFYESLTTERLILHIRYSTYMKEIIAVFSTEDITIYNHITKSKLSFYGKDVVLNELENLVATMIINRPTDYFVSLVSSLNLELSTLTLNDIRLINMVGC